MSDPIVYARIGGVDVYRLDDGTIHWRSGIRIDADGSPHAYHPVSARGLDRLANAGRPGHWWGIAVDGAGVPFVQTDADPAPGFYVSTTALEDPRFPPHDPRRYVDSERWPYLAIPSVLRARHGGAVHVGDLAWARCGARESWAIVADVGPDDAIGEGSIALARALGISEDARAGGCTGGVEWWIWPNSGKGWPRPDAAQAAEKLWLALSGR